MARPEIAAGDYRLVLAPGCGGSVAAFEWRGLALLRPMTGETVLDAACFPLVPFSNRIADGQFEANGRTVRLKPNFPGRAHPHPLHGYGWLSEWTVTQIGQDRATLVHRYSPGEWPWAYRAEQHFHLDQAGLTISLKVENLGDSPMPAGLGLHPYFPRTAATRYFGLHRGEWTSDSDGLPVSLDERVSARDWWEGMPAAARLVDTVYTGREGVLAIEFPERGVRLAITPSAELPFTGIFVPDHDDFFCVEPVSHATNAVNARSGGNGLIWLNPGESLEASIGFAASST